MNTEYIDKERVCDNYLKIQKIFGHEKVEKFLSHSISSEKIFPTWIFCGPRGIGKSSVAINFAKCLLAGITPTGESLEIDKDNPIHRLVDMRTHPDLFILEQSDKSISIDDTRNLMQKIRRTPTLSKWRVVIIENASDFNKNIYNSLLKILEEPPKNTVIIMICTNTGFIPKTLLSRVSKIYFNPIKTQLVQQILEKMEVENSDSLARLSNGSVGYALYLRDYNGIDIFNNLLKSFVFSEHKKSLQILIDNNCTENFVIIKNSLQKLFQIYIETLTEVVDYDKYQDEVSVFRKIISSGIVCVDKEIKKVLEIISMINRSDSLMLDKNAVLVYAYEKFFSND